MIQTQSGILTALLDRGFDGFSAEDIGATIRKLADREELRELTARYAFLVSQKRSAAELFTADGGFLFRTSASAVMTRFIVRSPRSAPCAAGAPACRAGPSSPAQAHAGC